MNDVHFSSNSNDWQTPQPLFDKLNRVFEFTLDPCSTKETSKCSKYFTAVEDGLKQSWANEIVFMNPPYGREIGKWIKKAYNESENNNVIVVCLIPARTDTSYWYEYIRHAARIIFIKGRIKFVSEGKANPAPFPSSIVVFDNFFKDTSIYWRKQEELCKSNHIYPMI